MKIPILSNYFEKQVRQKVSKLMGDYFQTDFIDKKYDFQELNYAPETKTDFALAYEKHVWTYASIYTIAINASQIPLKLYKKIQKKKLHLDKLS